MRKGEMVRKYLKFTFTASVIAMSINARLMCSFKRAFYVMKPSGNINTTGTFLKRFHDAKQ